MKSPPVQYTDDEAKAAVEPSLRSGRGRRDVRTSPLGSPNVGYFSPFDA
jgi:hypothetical protein